MKPAPLAIGALFLSTVGCAPSLQLESPADPPGLEREDEQSEQGTNVAPEPEPEGDEAESESFE
jgi:hypothetical protein